MCFSLPITEIILTAFYIVLLWTGKLRLCDDVICISCRERPTITQVLEIACVKAVAEPDERLKSVYGYSVSSSKFFFCQCSYQRVVRGHFI